MAGVKAGRRKQGMKNKAAKMGGVFIGATTLAGGKRLRNKKGGLATLANRARKNVARRGKKIVPRGRPGARNRG